MAARAHGDARPVRRVRPGTQDAALAYFTAAARLQLQEISRRQRAARDGVSKPQRGDLAMRWLAKVLLADSGWDREAA
jgi:hypothetical protein